MNKQHREHCEKMQAIQDEFTKAGFAFGRAFDAGMNSLSALFNEQKGIVDTVQAQATDEEGKLGVKHLECLSLMNQQGAFGREIFYRYYSFDFDKCVSVFPNGYKYKPAFYVAIANEATDEILRNRKTQNAEIGDVYRYEGNGSNVFEKGGEYLLSNHDKNFVWFDANTTFCKIDLFYQQFKKVERKEETEADNLKKLLAEILLSRNFPLTPKQIIPLREFLDDRTDEELRLFLTE